jgi:hypothetical protein
MNEDLHLLIANWFDVSLLDEWILIHICGCSFMTWFNFTTMKTYLPCAAPSLCIHEPNRPFVRNERHVPLRESPGKHNYFHSLTSFFLKIHCILICIKACRCCWKIKERGILRVSSSGIQSRVTIYYLILLQRQLLDFGKRITTCLPTVQPETFTGKLFLLWPHQMLFISPFSIPSCNYLFCILRL